MTSRIKLRCLALLLALAYPLALSAATPPAPVPTPPAHATDAFLAQLAGRWDLTGTLEGKPVHYHGEARWVLQDSWLQLNLIDTAAAPAYEASVYLGFDAKAGDYVVHWLDKFGASGARVVGTGRLEGQTLVLLFPYAEGAFRDTFRLAADGSSGSLLIENQGKDGSWSTFASYRLTRLPAAAQKPRPQSEQPLTR
jgi:Protein of unknown function (DUF1579)